MGRFCAERIIVREMDGVKIIFWDKSSIYMQWSKLCYVFHRWYAPKGTYNEWRNFKQLLLHRKNLTPHDVFELANRYGILSKYSVGHLKWKKKPIEIRFDGIKILGVGDDVQDVLRE